MTPTFLDSLPEQPSLVARVDQHSVAQPEYLFSSDDVAFLLRDRGTNEIWITRGIAERFRTIESARRRIADLTQSSDLDFLRAYGCVAFDPARAADEIWSKVPRFDVVLPAVTWHWKNGLVRRIVLGDDSPFLRALPVDTEKLPSIEFQEERPAFGHDGFRGAVKRLSGEFLREKLHKAVLCERVSLNFAEDVSVHSALRRLLERAPDSTVFACSFPGRGVFLGASPETLFRTHHETVEVESLAGTRPRGKSVEEDDRLSHELEHSRKEQREQALVTEFVMRALKGVCTDLKADATTVRRLPNVQHLHTRVSGTVKPDSTLDQLLDSLHPTPAVCGSPVDEAREQIRQLEPFDRGLYSGAVGWIARNEANWSVGIRAAMIQGSTAHLYAGAGIIPGSDPDQEYEECRWKMSLMRDVLTAS